MQDRDIKEMIERLGQEHRCSECGHLLFKGKLSTAIISINCPSCGASNTQILIGSERARFKESERNFQNKIEVRK